MSFQITLNERESLPWILSRAGHWSKFLGIDEGFADGSALDIAQPPVERDWVGDRGTEPAKIFFEDERAARVALEEILAQGWTSASLSNVPEVDWNREWQKSFDGAVVGEWQIVPPWKKSDRAHAKTIVIEPGSGFGTGTHETTQLCLEALSSQNLAGKRVLDFGSGSGILAIGAVKMGAEALGVEIDELAIENARRNAELNGVAPKFVRDFPASGAAEWDVVVANILRPVLIEFAPRLVRALKPDGVLILSGLLREDSGPIQRRFEPLLCEAGGEVLLRPRDRGDWIALAFERIQRPVSRR